MNMCRNRWQNCVLWGHLRACDLNGIEICETQKSPFLWISLARPAWGQKVMDSLPLQLSPKTNINLSCFLIYPCTFRFLSLKATATAAGCSSLLKREKEKIKLPTPNSSSCWLQYEILTSIFTWILKSFDYLSRRLLYEVPASKLNCTHFRKACTMFAFCIHLTIEVNYCLNCTKGFPW